MHDFQRESLSAIGVDLDKIIEIDPLQGVQCEKLICTSAPRGFSSNICPGWLIDSYRSVVLADNPQHKGERIYISRRDAGGRMLNNEEEVVEYLLKMNFSIITLSEYDFKHKVALFRDAEIIVGMTGAGMTNLMFASPGTKVLELHPPTFTNYLYASICAHLHLQYKYLSLQGRQNVWFPSRYFGSFTLPIASLACSLSAWLD